MSAIMHHPSDAVLIGYAAGSTGEAVSLVVASHLTQCAVCRARVARMEDVAGVMLDRLAPADMTLPDIDALVDAMEANGPPPPPPVPKPVPAAAGPPELAGIPVPLRDYLPDAPAWSSIAPGIRQMRLLKDRTGAEARLLKLAAGKPMPRHGHKGSEMTLVLSGAYRDETGRYGAGDIAEHDGADEHRPMVDRERDCICLVVTDAPLKFRGLVERLVQPFIGI